MTAPSARPLRVAVVGGGVSGLALTHRLLGRADVTVHEAGPVAGGHARTVREQGFVVEAGPNGFLDRTPGPLALVRELGLEGETIEACPASARRFLLRGGRLCAVPASPLSLLTTRALSPAGKARLLLEPWARRRPEGREETVHEFASRRIGRDAADTLVDTAVSGITAGDSRLLSLPAAFPLMDAMEREHGSLFRALAARRRAGRGAPRLFSMRGGLGRLVEALAASLGPRLATGAAITDLAPGGDAAPWILTRADGTTHPADRVVLALPAPAASRLVARLDGPLARTLEATPCSSVAVVALAYRRSDVRRRLDGYGYLVPRAERRSTLGVVWESSLFEGRAPAGFVLLRALMGGPRDPELAGRPASEQVERARRELADVLGISAAPHAAWTFAWPGAIPQYVRGHRERVDAARAAAARHAGLSLCGTSYDGVSLGAAIDAGRAHADRLVAGEAAP
jgi:oxygen-dependent protoporphyrinogen oxidase